ncbi:unnamed protein product [Dovyalis caffra]|uniref:Uncharacterized protein n=1 Tax=Dovyalis caffra TaxID=77055 RepID=A0AAV1R8L5_9ROSI|nr:unnamed protein product [Dovyalis caffra]
MAIENESNQMVLFINLSDLLLRNQEVEKIEKNRSFTTTDEGFLEKLRISNELLRLSLCRAWKSFPIGQATYAPSKDHFPRVCKRDRP